MTSKAIESNGISSISTSASIVESDGKEASADRTLDCVEF